MAKKDREKMRKYAGAVLSKPYVIGETKPCQHYNVTVGGEYCNECNTRLKD